MMERTMKIKKAGWNETKDKRRKEKKNDRIK